MKPTLLLSVLVAALLSSLPLPADGGPSAFWPLDGTLDDASGNGVPLVAPYKKQSFVPGLAGKAASFDVAQRNFLRLPATSPLDFTRDFTVAGWVKIPPPSTSVCYGIFKRWEYGGGAQFVVEYEGNKVTASLSTDGNNLVRVSSQAPLVSDEWCHVVLSYEDKSRTIRLWLTPQSAKVPEPPAEKPLDAPLFHPAKAEFMIGLGLGNHFLQGAVDEVVVFDRALPASEIAAIFTNGQKGRPATSR